MNEKDFREKYPAHDFDNILLSLNRKIRKRIFNRKRMIKEEFYYTAEEAAFIISYVWLKQQRKGVYIYNAIATNKHNRMLFESMNSIFEIDGHELERIEHCLIAEIMPREYDDENAEFKTYCITVGSGCLVEKELHPERYDPHGWHNLDPDSMADMIIKTRKALQEEKEAFGNSKDCFGLGEMGSKVVNDKQRRISLLCNGYDKRFQAESLLP